MNREYLEGDVITGSEALLRTLLREGVECLFGYPGGSVLYLYDAICDFRPIRHILTRHEQGAIHAADGYARATGRVGVCIATSGPGATNLITGLATAYADSVPIVVITGNAPSNLLGTDAFQEVYTVGIAMPVSKHTYQVQRAQEIPRIVREAFLIATTGRKGPVLIDVPKDISAATLTYVFPDITEHPVNRRKKEYRITDQFQSVSNQIVEAMRLSHQPLLLAGAGIIHAGGEVELLQLAEKSGIPVVTSLLGIGTIPGNHPLWLGMAGMHGTYTANQAIQQCDLLIGVGARFDDRLTMQVEGFAPFARIAQIDIDPSEFGRHIQAEWEWEADARTALSQMIEGVGKLAIAPWIKQIDKWRSTDAIFLNRSGSGHVRTGNSEGLKPQTVIDLICRTVPNNAIVVTDVGQHQMWTAHYFRQMAPRTFLSSGGMGTMGFGLPAAIGAQIGCMNRTVVTINGDGGLQMCVQELAICAIHQIPVKIAVINNGVLGMVRQWQELIYAARYSHIELGGSPDFVKLAEAYGVRGMRARSLIEAQSVWSDALKDPGPVLVDFVVDANENVYPMVSSGCSLSEMSVGPQQHSPN